MRALKRNGVPCYSRFRLVTTQAREGIETYKLATAPNSNAVTTQAREGIETTELITGKSASSGVTTQAREGIETG